MCKGTKKKTYNISDIEMSKQLKNKKPLIEATGGIHIGKNFFESFQASWPFGKIEVYEDMVVLKVQYIPDFILKIFEWSAKFPGPTIGSYKEIPKEIYLRYNEIRGYKERDMKIMGYGITFVHRNNKYPPFLQIWVSKKRLRR